jgi:HK97 gp10 family phage protein
MVTKIRITRVYDDRLVEQIEPAMRSLGQAVGARMQRLVPKRTWALHDSISTSTERHGSKITTTVGFGSSDVGYGLHVERGTSRMAAQPFARPALLQSRAGDLVYKGRGIINHGEVVAARRQRARDRAIDRKQARLEDRNES